MQFIIRTEDNGHSHIECPICSQHLTIKQEPHQLAVKATHHNTNCPWGGEWFRVHPNTGYAEKVAP